MLLNLKLLICTTKFSAGVTVSTFVEVTEAAGVSQSNAGVREETGRNAPSSQPHPSPFATRSQLRLEQGRREKWISSYLSDRSVTLLVQISADSKEDVG